MTADPLRIAMFSAATSGGAGAAALRVHDSLRLVGAQSTLYVGRREPTQYPGVVRIGEAEEGRQPPLVPGFTIFSVDPPGIPDNMLERIVARADVLNLHWYARFVSLHNIERMSRSGKPVVLTIRDMNPLTGGCHFFHGCLNWQANCLPCPQLFPSGIALPSATLEAKQALWELDNVSVVVLSEHTRRIVQSSILGRCRVETIPNPVDTSIFKPHNPEEGKREFGIPPQRPVIAFLPCFGSAVKGLEQAQQALRILTREMKDCILMCAGEFGEPLDVGLETVNVGFIGDRRRLARFYSSADVTLIPSTEETFSNTAAESVACGTPIVGFATGAIPEIAQFERGRAVAVRDTAALAAALADLLSSSRADPAKLHRYIAERCDARDIGRRYMKLFDELCTKGAPSVRESNVFGDDRRREARAKLALTMKQYQERRSRLSISLSRLSWAVQLLLRNNKEFRRRLRVKWSMRRLRT